MSAVSVALNATKIIPPITPLIIGPNDLPVVSEDCVESGPSVTGLIVGEE